MIKAHQAYQYAQKVLKGEVKAPKYVILQCAEFIQVANGKSRKYVIDEDKLDQIMRLLALMVMPKGLKAYQTVAEALAGFQWLFIVAVLCTVYRSNRAKRRYQTAILEICRKNGKTFLWLCCLFFCSLQSRNFPSSIPWRRMALSLVR